MNRWTPEMVARLGTATDREIAEDAGVARTAVVQARQFRGIPAYVGPNRRSTGRVQCISFQPTAFAPTDHVHFFHQLAIVLTEDGGLRDVLVMGDDSVRLERRRSQR